jgi:hypothetical protein
VGGMLMEQAKKRYTPPPSMAKSSINYENYGNQFRQNNSTHTIGDKVLLLIFYLPAHLQTPSSHSLKSLKII